MFESGEATAPRLRVLLDSADGDAVLRLAGEIDVTSATMAAAEIDRCLRHRPASMTIDLGSVTFCDCAGERMLQDAQRRAAAAGARFRLTGLTAPVRRTLDLMGATGLLATAADEPSPAQGGAG